MDYHQLLKKLYETKPDHVSNIAFWKLIHFADTAEIHYKEDAYNHLWIVKDNRLFFYYSWKEEGQGIVENREKLLFSKEDLEAYDLVILNQTQYDLLDYQPDHVEISQPFVYAGQEIPLRDQTLEDFDLRAFDFERDYDEAALIINRAYDWASYTGDHVKAFKESPAYDPDLWVWLVEKKTGKKAALGIGDFYSPIKEGSLDWVQVDPDFSKRGLGKYLVKVLVDRIVSKGGTIRVTGIADAFYQSCGLVTEEKWYILDNKKTYIGC